MKGKNYKLIVALLIHTMMVEEKMNKKITAVRMRAIAISTLSGMLVSEETSRASGYL